jgi:hypothetical protein
MSTAAFLFGLMAYIGVEIFLRSRAGEVDPASPTASLWGWRMVIVLLVAIDLYFGWPFFLV